MELPINGQLQLFEPLKRFCMAQDLPPQFSIEIFQFKDYSDLGSIVGAQDQLATVHKAIVAALPQQRPEEGWLAFSLKLQLLFRHQLSGVNPRIGLKESEITYAVAGFAAACQSVIYEASKAQMMGTDLPTFPNIYMKWLNSTIEISHKVYTYPHRAEIWRIRIIKHIYGRIGLMIEMPNAIHYVHDAQLACSAEGFMYVLLRDVAQIILNTYKLSSV